MAFFKKSASVEDIEETEEATVRPVKQGRKSQPKKGKKKKRNEMLASVLDESVPDAVLAELRECTDFKVEFQGKPYHVGWLLNVDDIGGLSKKTNRDEQKGSIIECINKGDIKVLVTAAMLEEEKLVIIPEKETLEFADDFELLKDAPYYTILISEDGNDMNLTGSVRVALADAMNVIGKFITIEQLLYDKGCPWAEPDAVEDEFDFDTSGAAAGAPVPSPQPQQSEQGAPGAAQGATQAMPPVSGPAETGPLPPASAGSPSLDVAFDDIVLDEQELNAAEVAKETQASTFEREIVTNAGDPDASIFDAEDEDDVSIETYTALKETKFYSDDLALSIDYSRFDAQFPATYDFPWFSEERPEGWLNEYLTQLSHEANVEIAAMHGMHVAQLRERYARLMGAYIDGVMSKLSLGEDDSGLYAQQYRTIRGMRDESMESISDEEALQKKELNAMYDREKEAVGEAAKRNAMAQYDSTHSRAHRAELEAVHMSCIAKIDADYDERHDHMLEERRHDAARRMDYGVNSILQLLSAEYAEMVEEEYALRDTHAKRIADWLEENRRNDVVWSEAVAEEQRQVQKADAVRDEMADRLRQANMDFEQRRNVLEATMKDMQTKHDAELADIQSHHEARLNELKADNERLQEREKAMLANYDAIKAEVAAEFSRRISEAEDARRAAEAWAERMEGMGKQGSYMWVTIAVVFALLALCLGMIVGWHMTMGYMTSGTELAPMIDVVPVFE